MGAHEAIDLQRVRREGFLEAMARGVCMVNIVTTDGPAGRRGMTLSAMASVSADSPSPTLVICVNSNTGTAAAIAENGVFCLNVLDETQQGIADCFAGRIPAPDGEKFGCANWDRTLTGAWSVEGAVASFDCRVEKSELIGTHHVVIGAVENVVIGNRTRPLLYGNRAYCAASGLSLDALP